MSMLISPAFGHILSYELGAVTQRTIVFIEKPRFYSYPYSHHSSIAQPQYFHHSSMKTTQPQKTLNDGSFHPASVQRH